MDNTQGTGTDQGSEAVRRADAMRVAFQGEPGAYSEEAAVALYGADLELLACETFDEVFEAVEAKDCERGVVPLENSLAGSIHRNYDLLLRHSLYIVGEHDLRVSHCLIAHPGVRLEDVRRVYSHPQALAQCEGSLAALAGVEVISAPDTAGSVRLVRERGWQDAAAIASESAARLYGMQVLRRGFEDEKTNFTRFVALGREQAPTSGGERKTSLAFAGKNEPGLLFRCLSAFALRSIDLSKIESRPIRGVPWQYVFYLDFAGGMDEERCQRAVDQLNEMATFVRVFGSYPRGRPAWLAEPDA